MATGRSSVRAFAIALLIGCIGASAAYAAGPVMPKADKSTATSLVSHRAVYDMSLAKVSQQSDGVRAAGGEMTYTLTDRCDGYTIETNLSLNLAFANGNENQVEQRYVAWEAKDGRSSTFRFQVIENGAVAKSYHGNIQFKEDGTGTATYESGETQTFELPRGTLLSTAHTAQLIKSAAAREKFIGKMVIDGSFDQGPFWVTAAIAPAHEGVLAQAKAKAGKDTVKDPGKDKLSPLTEGVYWPIGLAYFPSQSDQALPEYEITQNLLGTGVTHSMVQDFGGFTLAFKPVRVEPVAGPGCQ